MRFPKTIRFRKEEATIYGKTESYPFYRVAYYAGGRRLMKSFATYSEALAVAEGKVREIARGSQAPALSAKEAANALAIRDALEAHRRDTGRAVTALQAVTQYLQAAKMLGERSLTDAVEGYLRTVATVKRQDIGKAVEEFIQEREPKTVSRNGKRPQLSSKYAYAVAMWLREFGHTFPATAVCDLTKEHLNTYLGKHKDVAPKTRNERRNVVRMLLKWCVSHDYLAANHRLFEATGMQRELADPEEIDFYDTKELRTLLEGADAQMRPILALTALGGVREEEALRLTWEDVFRVPGHVEINVAKSKTRSRRLAPICAALEQWLAPYRNCSGPLWDKLVTSFHDKFSALRESLNIPNRRNGLRHGFCSYHFALHGNENLTAIAAGNSPAMIHAHYKGLATKSEADKWFGVLPAREANVIPLTLDATGRPSE